MQLADATVAIVGLGLMGGSLARALASNCSMVLGHDVDPVVGLAAERNGWIAQAGALDVVVSAADLVVLAAPVGEIEALLPQVAAVAKAGAVITDLGSTKRTIVAAMDALPERVAAVGGHPMCGREQGGLDAADPELFRGATWVVTNTARTTPAARTIVEELGLVVGAHAVDLTAERHDAAVATASHLPYVVAQALVATLAGSDEPAASELAATGFRSTTRLAGGNVDMWHDILVANADEVRAAIDRLVTELHAIEARLADPAGLRAGLERGAFRRRAL